MRPRSGIGIEDAPLLLADVFAWNKAYRRSFWDAAGLAFPEGVRYEDQPAITRALVAARFDVLTEPVYRWRVRTDGTSISQQRADVRDLDDRIRTKRWSTETVLADASAATREVWFARVLPIDMWEYFRSVPGCPPEYWALLVAGVRELWGPDTLPFEDTRVPARQRLMGWLVAADRRPDLERLIRWIDEGPESGTHPLSDDPSVPEDLRDL